MFLRKLLLFAALFFAGVGATSAQNQMQNPASIQDMMSPLRPPDGRAYVFYSQEELKLAQEKKSITLKQEIRKFHENPERVKVLRENRWRLENATIEEPNKK